jgi:hypothetical protein
MREYKKLQIYVDKITPMGKKVIPIIAFALSIIVPGSGYLYARNIEEGVMWFMIYLGMVGVWLFGAALVCGGGDIAAVAFVYLYLWTIITLGLHLTIAFLSYHHAKQYNLAIDTNFHVRVADAARKKIEKMKMDMKDIRNESQKNKARSSWEK